MDNSNWGPAQAESPTMDAGDWRSQLQPDSRQRIVNKIMETLKKHLPISGQEGLHELKKIAVRFEEKIYTAATSQSDYLRKISLKMLTMETKSQNSIANSLPSSSPCNSEHPSDPASHSMQSQVHNLGQSIPIPLAANQNQELLSQNIQSNIPAAGVQSSSSLPFALSPGAVLTQNPIPNVVSQIPNTQNISGVSQNLVGNSMVQRVPSNIFANSQKQMQGRQQVFPQQQQQQSQNQLMYQQQLQQQLYKQKFGMQSHIQQHQQQNILQPTQLQYSQTVMQTSSAMQPPVMQSAPLPGLQQANINSSSQSGLNVLQSNINTLQSNPNIHFYMKQQQEQQMLQSQQLQQQFQQQLIQKQLLQLYQQQQQLHQQTKKHENQKNHQVQSMNVQGAEATVQQNNMMNLQHGSLFSLSGVPTAQQYMMNLIRPSSKLDLEQSNTLSSLQQEVVGSLQQNPASAPQQANINTLSTQSEANLVKQKPISSMQQGQFPRHHMNHFNRTLLVSFFLMFVLLIFLLYVPCDLYSFIESLGF